MAEKKSKNYRQLSEKLDSILLWFETGDADLDEAVLKYEEATKLLKEMEDYLKNAENKIKKISVTKE